MESFDFSTNFANKGFAGNSPFMASANGDSPFMGSVFNSPFNSSLNQSFNSPFSSPFSGFGNSNNGNFFGNNNSFMNINNMSFMQAVMRARSKNNGVENNGSESTDASITWNKNFTRVEFNEKENKKIDEISQRLGCNPNDLKAVIYAESGGNPRAVNPSGATGLIQFMPDTAKGLGTTTAALKNMTIEQQLDYVEKHLQGAKAGAGFAKTDKIDSGTLYSLVFLPAFAKRDVLCQSDSIYYKANSGLDKNKDGLITKADLATQMKSFA